MSTLCRKPRISASVQFLSPALLVACACVTPVAAESLGSAASSASSAGSASLGSLSDSVKGSSRSSTDKAQVAEGAYQVLEVAAAPDKPTHRSLRLRPVDRLNDAAGELQVLVPTQALGDQGMLSGEVIQIRHRVYGLEFARSPQAGRMEPFFLALDDAWHRQLGSRALSL